MIGTQNLPTISQLYDLIDAVPTYPVSAAQLTRLATKKGADWRVVDFYRAFPPDVTFEDSDDLATRSEQIEMLNLDEQPVEEIRSPEE